MAMTNPIGTQRGNFCCIVRLLSEKNQKIEKRNIKNKNT
jgi:hypothetical protein